MRRSRILVATAMIPLVLILAWFFWQNQDRHAAPTVTYEVVRSFPHDTNAYCQGLVINNGILFEGTGGTGRSSLRKIELETGKVIQQHDLTAQLFGEGITVWKDRIYQLTWRNRQAIVYKTDTFRELGRYSYRGEGWGLTHDGKHLIMSNGTSTLRFLDPDTFKEVRHLTVRDGRRQISRLNELEYVEGYVLANIWYQDRIAIISPKTGYVRAWVNLAKLYPASRRPSEEAVLNGIAYDAKQRRLFVTGKNWPRLFEIRLTDTSRRSGLLDSSK